MTEDTEDRTIDMARVCDIIRALGAYAYVEYTGGGVATIYASADEAPGHPGMPSTSHTYACATPGHYHDPGAQAIAGPGWFTDDNGARADLSDFYVGPDDQGCETPYRATDDDDEGSLAVRMMQVIRADQIADAFIADLKENLTDEQFQEMRRLNATPEYAVADASHEYLDANECMTAAFNVVLGRDADPTDDDDSDLWNRAWDIARRRALVAR